MKGRPIRMVVAVFFVIASVLIVVRVVRGEPDPPDWAMCATEQVHEFPQVDERFMDGVDTELAIALPAPTAVAHRSGDPAYLLLQRSGEVSRVEDDEIAGLALDLSQDVSLEGEQGLLDGTFSPHGRHLYLHLTDLEGHTTILEYEVDDGLVIDEASRRTVFELDQPHYWHNGGRITFGPDDYLYIGLGDGGADTVDPDPNEFAQDRTVLHGSLLRIDPRPTTDGDPYGIPPDNPFIEDANARSEIYAYGLRNPWRFDIDAESGDLWLADVGHMCWEEVNYVPSEDIAGSNFGWRTVEGVHHFTGEPPSDLTPPVFVNPLPRAQSAWGDRFPGAASTCAVIGGAVYRGDLFPELEGAFLFSDHCGGQLWALRMGDGGAELFEVSGINDQVLSVEPGPDGEVLLLGVGGVYMLVPEEPA